MPVNHGAWSLRKKLAFASIPTLILLCFVEGMFWLVAPLSDPFPFDPQAGSYHRFLPHWNNYQKFGEPPFDASKDLGRLAGVSDTVAQVRINQYGYLYPEQAGRRTSEGEVRIAVIGGSTVECLALPPEKRWPEVMGQLLKQDWAGDREVTVLNLGISGQDTRTHLATVVQHVANLDIDFVVFMLGANDLFRARGSDSLLDSIAIKAASPSRPSTCALLTTRTQLGRRLRLLVRGVPDDRARRPGEPYFASARDRLRQAPLLPFDPEIPAGALDEYGRNIITLASVCRAHGMRILFVTQPMLWHSDRPLSDKEHDVSWCLRFVQDDQLYRMKSKSAARLLGSLNTRLMQVCQSRGYPCLDLAARLPETLKIFYDDVHYTERGARVVAT